ncbi:MAG: type II toxin-antitoxin system VapC family toxin [Bacillota bacterium]|jgi:predicted nucleic acid-binding protein
MSWTPPPIVPDVQPIAVVDASVVAKWFLKDEIACSAAVQMKEDFVEGRISIVAPSLFVYEMASLLGVSVKRGRLTAQDAIDAFEELTAMRIPLIEHSTITPLAVSMAAANGHSAYDNAYVALAMALNSQFYTADKVLLRNLGTKYAGWVRDIDAYSCSMV